MDFLFPNGTSEIPIANPKAVIVSSNVRISVLMEDVIRIEYSPTRDFEDRASQIIINRN